MSVDKHTLQQWVAGTEIRFRKTRQPLSNVPLVNRLGKLSATKQNYTVTEKIDLTRARNFCAQEASEDILFASIQLPVLGKMGVGNDVGMAVAAFDYTDQEGDNHKVIVICAYSINGVVKRERVLKQTIAIPMV